MAKTKKSVYDLTQFFDSVDFGVDYIGEWGKFENLIYGKRVK
jgi:hypothetical protein